MDSALNFLRKNGYINPNNNLHINQALYYSTFLSSLLGGNKKINEILVILKELLDVDKEFSNLIDEKLIQDLILNSCLPKDKFNLVNNYFHNLLVKNKPAGSLDEKIIEDSTRLNWFGPKGIIKLHEYSNNNHIDLCNAFLDCCKSQRPFHFPETANVYKREKKFSDLYFGLLKSNTEINKVFPGKYIILEGNGGVGKDTQAKLLQKEFIKIGKKTLIIQEPSILFRDFENYWERKYSVPLDLDKPDFRFFSLIGDRLEQVNNIVKNELEAGSIVISTRSFISMMVYQCESDIEILKTLYIHEFVPNPDCIIIFDLDENISYQRILSRGKLINTFGKIESLKKHRKRYLYISKLYLFGSPIFIVDANGTTDEVLERTKEIIMKFI